MKLYSTALDFENTLLEAQALTAVYPKQVTFHCYWNGALNEKHAASIFSCAHFNPAHKIILWVENTGSAHLAEIEKIAEIRPFSLRAELAGTFLENVDFYYLRELSHYSDVVRYLLLYKYGGVWFDLDCFFLRGFDPLFNEFGAEVCVYAWELQPHPNGAIFIALEPEMPALKRVMEFIVERGRGWGFLVAKLTYDLPLDLLVLPCAWFDADWVPNTRAVGMWNFFAETPRAHTLDTFFKGSFCYHWHNQWNAPVAPTSAFNQLLTELREKKD